MVIEGSPHHDRSRRQQAASPTTGGRSPGRGSGEGWSGEARLGSLDLYFGDVPNRLIAYLIDVIVVSILVFGGVAAVSLVLGPTVRIDRAADVASDRVTLDRSLALVDTLVAAGIHCLYFTSFWTTLGATPGQRLLRLRVGNVKGGDRPTPGRSLLRWVVLGAPLVVLAGVIGWSVSRLVVEGAVLVWYLVLLTTVALSPMKRGLHDRAAHTVVVKSARSVGATDLDDKQEQ